jgi:hypothetical protein
LNPYAAFATADFKSAASTVSPPRPKRVTMTSYALPSLGAIRSRECRVDHSALFDGKAAGSARARGGTAVELSRGRWYDSGFGVIVIPSLLCPPCGGLAPKMEVFT